MKINVTKTHMPAIKEFKNYVKRIFQNNWVTNNGDFVKELTLKLENYLGVRNLLLVSNGTIALQIAYRLLNLKNDVVTTPFSFVATTSSILWERLNPIFADIEKDSFNLSANNISKVITKKTTGIVPVHVFGNACEIEKIEHEAQKYNLRVIYDASHCFGVTYKGKNILNYGDISTISFHATKLFHTIEGGALIIKDDKLFKTAKRMINFGYENGEILSLGINAKMNEFQAVMGLCVLKDMDELLLGRKKVYYKYKKELKGLVQFQKLNEFSTLNYSYFPILFESENQLQRVLKDLNKNNIYPRRYFYPSLDTLNYLKKKEICEVSLEISKRILCLPLYKGVSLRSQNKIISTLRQCS